MRSPSLNRIAVIVCLISATGFGALALILGNEGRDAIPDRLDSGLRLRVIDHVQSTKWWVAAIGASLMLVAASTAKWWAGPRKCEGLMPKAPVTWPGWRWWAVAGFVLLIAAWLRTDRIDLSLYNDEAYTFRRYVAGEFREDSKTKEVRFRQADWTTTLWHMEVGNNSPPYSALSRLSYEWVARRANLAPAEVHEQAIRFPAVIASVAGLLILGLLARRLAAPDHGLLVMAVGALHPWMVRYGSEARGHSLLLLLIPLLLWFVILALQQGTWRCWLGVGIASTMMMWAFPGTVFWLIAVNVVIGLLIASTWWRNPKRRSAVNIQSMRWLITNSAAALLFGLLFAPLFNQIRVSLGEVSALSGGPHRGWLLDFWGLASVGMPWTPHNPESPVSLSVLGEVSQGNFLPMILAGAFLLAIVIGIFRSWRRSPSSGALLTAAAVIAPLIAFLSAHGTDTVLHLWYAVSAAPVLLMLAVMAFPIGGEPPLATGRKWLGWGLALLGFGFWVAAVSPQLNTIARHSVQPIREAVELIRGDVYPHYQDRPNQVKHASFWTDVTRYDPWVRVTWSVEALQSLEQEASLDGQPLFVVFGHRSNALNTAPDLVAYIEDSGRYEHVSDLHGTDQGQFNHHVYRWLNDKTIN
jgi:hypothetical protein